MLIIIHLQKVFLLEKMNSYLISILIGSRLCPIIRVPPSKLPSTTINCSLIDFVWLTSNHFVIVYLISSSSDCHLYSI